MSALRVVTDVPDVPVAPGTRRCWQCAGRYLEADFANGRCISCVATGVRDTTIRLAVRILRDPVFAHNRLLRERHVFLLMARAVERQAELEGITCSITLPNRLAPEGA